MGLDLQYLSNWVYYNENFVLNYEVLEAYQFENFVVTVNGQVYNCQNNSLEISNIKEDITISFSGVTKKSFDITLPEVDGCIIQATSTNVYYGDDLTISLTPLFGYTLENVVVKLNDVAVTPNNNSFEIQNITSYINITITNIDLIEYSVTLPDQGVTINIENEKDTYTILDSIVFTYTIKVGYVATDEFEISATNCTLSCNNETYTISNIVGNVTISVEGLDEVGCKLIYNDDGTFTVEILDAKEKYELGDYIYFKIIPSVENIGYSLYINGIFQNGNNGEYSYRFNTQNVYEYNLTVVFN